MDLPGFSLLEPGCKENKPNHWATKVRIIMKNFLKRHSLVTGLVLMFLFTWPVDLANSGVIPIKFPFGVYIFLGWGFIFASLIMTGLTLGRDDIIRLVKRFLIWRVELKWYLSAFLLLPAIYAAAVLLMAALAQPSIDFSTSLAYQLFGSSANLPVYILPFFIFEFLSNGEEMGWRGYVLPRLQAKHSALASSLILGLVWGFWHLPKYLAPDYSGSFALNMVKFLTEAILYTWLFNNTRGSLLLTTIMHAAGNTAGVFLPLATTLSGSNTDTMIIVVTIEVLIAIVLTISTGSQRLSQTEAILVQN
jgi:membrane protease YdiL (CAAX protease family)